MKYKRIQQGTSMVCQQDAYRNELLRYIHLNPVYAGIVRGLKELNNHPYCGHSSVIGKKKRPWQDVDYLLGYCGRTPKSTREAYSNYVEGAIGQGRHGNLTGRGLIRSIGGSSELKRLPERGQEHVMSDERILGNSEFVALVRSQAEERYERRDNVKRLGYDLNSIAERVAEIYEMEPSEIVSKGKRETYRHGVFFVLGRQGVGYVSERTGQEV